VACTALSRHSRRTVPLAPLKTHGWRNISITLKIPPLREFEFVNARADFGWENQRTIRRTMAVDYQPFYANCQEEAARLLFYLLDRLTLSVPFRCDFGIAIHIHRASVPTSGTQRHYEMKCMPFARDFGAPGFWVVLVAV